MLTMSFSALTLTGRATFLLGATTCGAYGKLSCRSRTDSVKSVGGPPMQQIADWLKKLGLPEYAERFAENGIDVSVLPHLTDQDLKDMGVLLGHRRRMLAAIGEVERQTCSGRAPATGASMAPIPTAVAMASPIA